MKTPVTDLRRSAARLALLGTTVALAACPGVHVRLERPYPPPTAAALREVLAARQRAVTGINAVARATSWLGGDRIRATVLMLVDRAGRLRLGAEVSLQGTVAVLATDGQRFALLDARKNELRRGPACPANIASLIRIPLGPADVAAIFLGDAKLPSDAPAEAASDVVDWDGDAGADVLAVRRSGGQLRYLLRHESAGAAGTWRLIGVTAVDGMGQPAWRVSFEDFADVALASGSTRVSLPQTIRFAEGRHSFDDGVEIKFKERTVNDTFAADAFSLATPPGATTIEVGCP